MIAFVCTHPSIRITVGIAMVTMYFHKAQMSLNFGTFFFRVQGVPGNNLATMKIVRGCKVGQIRSRGTFHLQKSIRLSFKIEINLILGS